MGRHMEPWHHDDQATIYHGDCLEVLRELPDASVDAVVTDPPYGLGFMGKAWDDPAAQGAATRPRADGDHTATPFKRARAEYGGASYGGNYTDDMRAFQAWSELWAAECLRVLKPGGHLLAFGGTRTWHRLACAIEDAGFEVRDSIAWMYGSGFPKSLDVSKAIDKRGGSVAGFTEFRDAVREAMRRNGVSRATLQAALGNHMLSHYLTARSQPAVPNARDYRIIRDTVRLGDSFDPLFLDEAEREVVGKGHSGKTAIWAPGGMGDFDLTAPATDAAREWSGWGTALKPAHEPIVVARKPLVGTVAANVLEHGTGALNIDACRIDMGSDYDPTKMQRQQNSGGAIEGAFGAAALIGKEIPTYKPGGRWPANVVLDEDQAAELDRQSGVSKSTPFRRKDGPATFGGDFGNGQPVQSDAMYADSGGASRFFYVAKAPARERPKVDGTAHPTVKPLTLMRWLCRLVTPPDGVILEPFAGSGTTVEAALLEGFRVVAIEREADYLPLIQARLDRVAAQEPEDEQLTLDASA